MIKQAVLGAAISSIALGLTGCASVNWSVTGKCNTQGVCEVSGTVTNQKSMSIPLLDRLLKSSGVADASQFKIDTTGTSVYTPSTGMVTVKLVDSSTGVLQAAATFPWVKSGSNIVLSNPDAVNAWALANGGTADSMEYELLPFAVQQTAGSNTLRVGAAYQGTTYAVSTTTWRGGGGGCSRIAECQIQ
jgi:hypothetical protein